MAVRRSISQTAARKAAWNDQEALGPCMAIVRAIVRAIARRWAAGGCDYDDCLQEGSIAMLRAMADWRPGNGCKMTTLVHLYAWRAICDYTATARRREQRSLAARQERRQADDIAPSDEDAADRAELAGWLLSGLSGRRLIAATLCLADGRSLAEAAELMGISKTAVARHRGMALRQMRRKARAAGLECPPADGL